MVATYTIFGKQVASHWISIATLTAAIGGAVIPSYLPKGEASPTKTLEPVTAPAVKEDDLDVEKLLDNFLKDNEEKK